MIGWVRARSARPQISADDARDVLEQFGLRLVNRPANLSLGWRNHHVVVGTSAGRKVLERYRSTASRGAVVHEHSIIEHLLDRSFPAVRVNRTLADSTIVECHGELFALFDFEPGRHYATSFLTRRARRSLLRIAGLTLGELHDSLDGFQPDGRHHLGFDGSGNRARDVPWCLEKLDGLASGRPVHEHSSDVDAESSSHLHWLRSKAGYIRVSLQESEPLMRRAALPRLVVHGDYGLHNLLFRSDGTAVVHDFELARRDWRLLDIGIALKRIDPDNRVVFLDGYRARRELPADELELLPVLWRHHLLTGAIRSWYGFGRLGGQARLATARARVVACENGSHPGLPG